MQLTTASLCSFAFKFKNIHKRNKIMKVAKENLFLSGAEFMDKV